MWGVTFCLLYKGVSFIISMSAVDWKKIKSAYLNTDLRVVDICAKFNIKPHQLYAQIRSERWVKRRQSRQSQSSCRQQNDDNLGAHKGLHKRSHKGHGSNDPTPKQQISHSASSIESLYQLVETMTQDLLSRLHQRENDSAVERERDIKTLSSLVQTIDRIRQLKEKEGGKERALINKNSEGQLCASDLASPETRAALAARLETLIKKL